MDDFLEFFFWGDDNFILGLMTQAWQDGRLQHKERWQLMHNINAFWCIPFFNVTCGNGKKGLMGQHWLVEWWRVSCKVGGKQRGRRYCCQKSCCNIFLQIVLYKSSEDLHCPFFWQRSDIMKHWTGCPRARRVGWDVRGNGKKPRKSWCLTLLAGRSRTLLELTGHFRSSRCMIQEALKIPISHEALL